MDIILASQSPRRRELLERMGLPFRIITPDIDEHMERSLPPGELVAAISAEKAGAVAAQAKHGLVTLCRFDGDNGEYSLLLGTAKGIDGPYTKGTYLWVEVENWKRLEAKLVEGPYIHHCVGIHKDVVPVLYEACKYLGITPDLYDNNEEQVKAYLRGE